MGGFPRVFIVHVAGVLRLLTDIRVFCLGEKEELIFDVAANTLHEAHFRTFVFVNFHMRRYRSALDITTRKG